MGNVQIGGPVKGPAIFGFVMTNRLARKDSCFIIKTAMSERRADELHPDDQEDEDAEEVAFQLTQPDEAEDLPAVRADGLTVSFELMLADYPLRISMVRHCSDCGELYPLSEDGDLPACNHVEPTAEVRKGVVVYTPPRLG